MIHRRRRERSAQEELLDTVLERDFQERVLETADWLGWKHYHTHDSRRSVAGFQDLVLVKPPRVIFAELKRQSESPKGEQLVWFGLLCQCQGVEVYVWRPGDIDTIDRILQGGKS